MDSQRVCARGKSSSCRAGLKFGRAVSERKSHGDGTCKVNDNTVAVYSVPTVHRHHEDEGAFDSFSVIRFH